MTMKFGFAASALTLMLIAGSGTANAQAGGGGGGAGGAGGEFGNPMRVAPPVGVAPRPVPRPRRGQGGARVDDCSTLRHGEYTILCRPRRHGE